MHVVRRHRKNITAFLVLLSTAVMLPGISYAEGLPRYENSQFGGYTVRILGNVLLLISAISIILGITLTGMFLITKGKNAQERAEGMQRIKYLIIGCFILFGITIIPGILFTYATDLFNQVYQPATPKVEDKNVVVKGLKEGGSFIINILATIVNAIAGIIIHALGILGIKPLFSLFINEANPFKGDIMKKLLYFYWLVTLISFAGILIMVATTGMRIVFAPGPAQQRKILMDDLKRWFFVVLLIVLGPAMMEILLNFFGAMAGWISELYVNLGINLSQTKIGKMFLDTYFQVKTENGETVIDTSAFQDFFGILGTKDPLTTAVVKLIYLIILFKINLTFWVRKLVLGIMLLFTPIAAVIWGIKRDTLAAKIWWGEILTNSAMSFFYCFSLLASTYLYSVLVEAGVSNWVLGLLVFYMIPKTAEILRNGLQGFFTNLAGIHEEEVASGFFRGAVTGMVGGLTHAVGKTLGSPSSAKLEDSFLQGSGTIPGGGPAPTGGTVPGGGPGPSGGPTQKVAPVPVTGTTAGVGTSVAGGGISATGGPMPSVGAPTGDEVTPIGGGITPAGGGVPPTGGGGIPDGQSPNTSPSGTSGYNPVGNIDNDYKQSLDAQRYFYDAMVARTNQSGAMKFARAMEGVAEFARHTNNPLLQFVAGGLAAGARATGGYSAIKDAMTQTTLARMANSEEYRNDFVSIKGLYRKFEEKGYADKFQRILTEGDSEELLNTAKKLGIQVDSKQLESFNRIRVGFVDEHEKTQKLLGLQEKKIAGTALKTFGVLNDAKNVSYILKNNAYNQYAPRYIYKF